MTKRRHLKAAKLRQSVRQKKGKPVVEVLTTRVITYPVNRPRYDDYSLAA